MSRLKHEMQQYAMEQIDDVDARLLHGVYQAKVMTQKEIQHEPVSIIDKIAGAKDQAKELGKKKNRHRRNKSAGHLQDFDRFGSSRNEIMDITTDINGNGNKLPEIAGSKGTTKAAQSFVLMPVGANRKKLR